jgi:hypothetical protein
MKLFKFLVCIAPLFLATFISPTTINGRFTVSNIDSSKLSVIVQINTNAGTDDLGGATIVFEFDTSALGFSNNPIKNVDYIFHNFYGGNYSPATVTRPMNNKMWVNIDLPFTHTNNGTVVTGSPGWIDVVTIYFDVINLSNTTTLSWNTSSLFWGIYDADNTTLWENGTFQDLIDFQLPVELISFTAKIVNENVRLDWITSTEVDNYGFDIERTSSLITPVQEWKKIGFVQGHGNSNSPKHYSFIDDKVIGESKFKYRLKQIDTDGQFEYSETVEVDVIPAHFVLHQNYPNPFNPSSKIKYQIPSLGTRDHVYVEIRVFDILGNEITTLVNEEKPAGTYEVEFDAINFPSGVYFYQLKFGNFVETKKMVLMK